MNIYNKLLFVFICLAVIACEEKVDKLVVPESVMKTLKSCVTLEEKYGNKAQYSESELKDMQAIHKQCIDEQLNYIKSGGPHSIEKVKVN
jgi:hypothetical protein